MRKEFHAFKRQKDSRTKSRSVVSKIQIEVRIDKNDWNYLDDELRESIFNGK
jgi:hypothetical protein